MSADTHHCNGGPCSSRALDLVYCTGNLDTSICIHNGLHCKQLGCSWELCCTRSDHFLMEVERFQLVPLRLMTLLQSSCGIGVKHPYGSMGWIEPEGFSKLWSMSPYLRCLPLILVPPVNRRWEPGHAGLLKCWPSCCVSLNLLFAMAGFCSAEWSADRKPDECPHILLTMLTWARTILNRHCVRGSKNSYDRTPA